MTNFGDASAEAAIAKPQTQNAELYASAMGRDDQNVPDIQLRNQQNADLVNAKLLPGFEISMGDIAGTGKWSDGKPSPFDRVNPLEKQPVSIEQSMEAYLQARNAEKEFAGLMKKAHGDFSLSDGLNMADLKALLARNDLTDNQRAAVKYMMDKENYDALQTGGWRGKDRITQESLAKYAPEATNIPGKYNKKDIPIPDFLKPNGSAERQKDGNPEHGIPGRVPGGIMGGGDRRFAPQGQEQAKDGAVETGRVGHLPGRGGERPVTKSEQSGEQTTANDKTKDEIVVQKNWGWSDVAKESLRRSGLPNTRELNLQEQKRLQKENNNVPLHPGTRIKRGGCKS